MAESATATYATSAGRCRRIISRPQVIFRDMEELDLLLTALEDEGATRINLNMGCPFPLQTGKGAAPASSQTAPKPPDCRKSPPGIPG